MTESGKCDGIFYIILMTEISAPLLVTLTMDDASFGYFNALRIAHFPPERNHIPAHITLFHALPGNERAAIEAILEKEAAAFDPFLLTTSGLKLLGRGNAAAFMLESRAANELRGKLAKRFWDWLKPQDQHHAFRPHITVQNKVSIETAQTLLAHLNTNFQPRDITAIGMDLWIYRGGPWEYVRGFSFEAN